MHRIKCKLKFFKTRKTENVAELFFPRLRIIHTSWRIWNKQSVLQLVRFFVWRRPWKYIFQSIFVICFYVFGTDTALKYTKQYFLFHYLVRIVLWMIWLQIQSVKYYDHNLIDCPSIHFFFWKFDIQSINVFVWCITM